MKDIPGISDKLSFVSARWNKRSLLKFIKFVKVIWEARQKGSHWERLRACFPTHERSRPADDLQILGALVTSFPVTSGRLLWCREALVSRAGVRLIVAEIPVVKFRFCSGKLRDESLAHFVVLTSNWNRDLWPQIKTGKIHTNYPGGSYFSGSLIEGPLKSLGIILQWFPEVPGFHHDGGFETKLSRI